MNPRQLGRLFWKITLRNSHSSKELMNGIKRMCESVSDDQAKTDKSRSGCQNNAVQPARYKANQTFCSLDEAPSTGNLLPLFVRSMGKLAVADRFTRMRLESYNPLEFRATRSAPCSSMHVCGQPEFPGPAENQ